MAGKFKRSEVAKMPDDKKVKVYAGGEVRTVTGRQLKKQMGITGQSSKSKSRKPINKQELARFGPKGQGKARKKGR